MMVLDRISSWVEQTEKKRISELMDLLSIPSVSTSPEHTPQVREAAGWLQKKLFQMGFEVELVETEGHPVVIARRCPCPGGPTVLIYGHYDVQPTDPNEEWLSPPFSPEIKDGCVYARGASDDKGQLLTHIHALEAILEARGELPLNVKLLLEGEEEIGSPSLPKLLGRRIGDLEAQTVVISDGSQFAPGIPAITYGLRGLAYLEVEIQGPRFDLHSGAFGGLVRNPVQVLCRILAALQDEQGRIAVPGFYEDVIPLELWEKEELGRLPFDEEVIKRYLGVEVIWGERGYTPLERRWARPTFDISGIWGGFSGTGAKTIIPAKAGAKIGMRLVPNQDPQKISRLVGEFIRAITPEGVKVHIKELHGAEPVLIDRSLPQVQAAVRAIEFGFGTRPVFIREGGSIPVVNMLKRNLGIEAILLLGWGSPEDGAHSPNERFSLEDFTRGTKASAALLLELGSCR